MTNGNGVVTAYTYRPDNRRLLNVQATLPIGYTFNNFNFTYDKVGNLLTLQNTAQMPGTSPRAVSATPSAGRGRRSSTTTTSTG
jgi:hypothetical protein